MRKRKYRKRHVDKELVGLRKKFPYQLSEWLKLVELEGIVENLERHKSPYCVIENPLGQFAVFTSGKQLVKEKKRKQTSTVCFAKSRYQE